MQLVTALLCFVPVVLCEIRNSPLLNRLKKIKAVGGTDRLLALTEIPPPTNFVEQHAKAVKSARRHFVDCDAKPDPHIVYEGPKVDIVGDYYEEGMAKIVKDVVFPIHIDHMHFEVTTAVPYYTVGTIEAVGFHPTLPTPSECDKIYLDHLAEQYSEETMDYSEESLEMARMPLFGGDQTAPKSNELYSDLEHLKK